MPVDIGNIQELYEKSVFEAIRLIIVDQGYLPDITTYPATTAGRASYLTDLKAIVTSKGFAIELFGNSSNQSKGEEAVPRIIIDTLNLMPGSLGLPGNPQYDAAGGSFKKYALNRRNSSMNFNITIVSKSAAQERVMQAIINYVIAGRNYLQTYDQTNYFLCEQFNFYTYYDRDKGLKYKVFGYTIPDMNLTPPKDLNETIAKIGEITVKYAWEIEELWDSFLDADFEDQVIT